MKILICLFLILIPVLSIADANDEMKLQLLNSQIESLTKERDEKYAKLKQCEQKTRGFKIAGITTLVATGFGIYGNIKLAQRLRDGDNMGKTSNKNVQDTRSEETKGNWECENLFCVDDREFAIEKGCEC